MSSLLAQALPDHRPYSFALTAQALGAGALWLKEGVSAAVNFLHGRTESLALNGLGFPGCSADQGSCVLFFISSRNS